MHTVNKLLVEIITKITRAKNEKLTTSQTEFTLRLRDIGPKHNLDIFQYIFSIIYLEYLLKITQINDTFLDNNVDFLSIHQDIFII